MTSKRRKWVGGDVYSLALPTGGFGYFVLMESPDVSFLKLKTEEVADMNTLMQAEEFYNIWCAPDLIKRAPVTKLGHIDFMPTYEFRKYTKDRMNGRFYLLTPHNGNGVEITKDQARLLEPAMAWRVESIIDRLDKNLNGEISYWQLTRDFD